MPSTVYYLVGPPGSGKRTIGKHLARLTGAALLDNHLSNAPVFTAFGLDGQKPVPAEVWTLVRRVRAVVLEAALAALRDVSHIFTNYLTNEEREWQFVQSLRDLSSARGATFVPVWLTCDTEELARRMSLPERAERLKLRDPEQLRALLRDVGNLPPPPDAIRIDTSYGRRLKGLLVNLKIRADLQSCAAERAGENTGSALWSNKRRFPNCCGI